MKYERIEHGGARTKQTPRPVTSPIFPRVALMKQTFSPKRGRPKMMCLDYKKLSDGSHWTTAI